LEENINKMEGIQKSAESEVLGLNALEVRRKRGDSIQIYKIS